MWCPYHDYILIYIYIYIYDIVNGVIHQACVYDAVRWHPKGVHKIAFYGKSYIIFLYFIPK